MNFFFPLLRSDLSIQSSKLQRLDYFFVAYTAAAAAMVVSCLFVRFCLACLLLTYATRHRNTSFFIRCTHHLTTKLVFPAHHLQSSSCPFRPSSSFFVLFHAVTVHSIFKKPLSFRFHSLNLSSSFISSVLCFFSF